MSRSRYFFLCVLAVAGAFAGSYAASHGIPVAHAQVVGPQEMRATAFTLVDRNGKVEATLRTGSMGAELVLNDTNGKPRAEAGASGFVVRDTAGRVVWASPQRTGIVPASE